MIGMIAESGVFYDAVDFRYCVGQEPVASVHRPDSCVMPQKTRTENGRIKIDRRKGSGRRHGGRSHRWDITSKWYRQNHPWCAVCDAPAEHVDHIVPTEEGGSMYDEANLQSLCRRCHSSKTGREVFQRGRIN